MAESSMKNLFLVCTAHASSASSTGPSLQEENIPTVASWPAKLISNQLSDNATYQQPPQYNAACNSLRYTYSFSTSV